MPERFMGAETGADAEDKVGSWLGGPDAIAESYRVFGVGKVVSEIGPIMREIRGIALVKSQNRMFRARGRWSGLDREDEDELIAEVRVDHEERVTVPAARASTATMAVLAAPKSDFYKRPMYGRHNINPSLFNLLSLEAASPASAKIYPGPGLDFRLGGFAPLDSGKEWPKNPQRYILLGSCTLRSGLCDGQQNVVSLLHRGRCCQTLRRRLTTVKFGLAFRLLEEGE
ncbi:hypothetical protein DFH08DRAFT_1038942 [Mycena albidolilacea]|uniref:Uncharacterized protein n=1 Tax=Mycena albidolilacea TaxID=1033008 RepID=A0AAD7AIL3_9AGAR|nr:hypothetical protein DFH08DRAFT_1038942 [Mycena albidolilacea]